jgi:PIN domain nuclease of toxin-antitoxin system
VIALDTHAALWMLAKPEKLSRRARRAIEQARTGHEGLAISAVTLYELAQGVSRNRMQVHAELDEVLGQIEELVTVMPLTSAIAARAAKLPDSFPRDPFDRIIAATAIVRGVLLVTADVPIRRSGVLATIW